MADYTLYYFPIFARGYAPALVASVGGLNFEWNKQPDWPAFKSQTPFGQLPVLKTKDGLTVGQSLAIVRFLARKAKLEGETDAEYALSEQLIQESEDIYTGLAKANSAADRTAAMDEFLAKALKNHLDNLAKLLKGDTFSGKLLAGDLAIFAVLDIVVRLQADALDSHPTLKAFHAHVGANDKVKAVQGGVHPYFKRHSDAK